MAEGAVPALHLPIRQWVRMTRQRRAVATQMQPPALVAQVLERQADAEPLDVAAGVAAPVVDKSAVVRGGAAGTRPMLLPRHRKARYRMHWVKRRRWATCGRPKSPGIRCAPRFGWHSLTVAEQSISTVTDRRRGTLAYLWKPAGSAVTNYEFSVIRSCT